MATILRTPLVHQSYKLPRAEAVVVSSSLACLTAPVFAPFVQLQTEAVLRSKRVAAEMSQVAFTLQHQSGAVPFVPLDHYIPLRAKRYIEVTDCALAINLYGKDQFFGAPGEVATWLDYQQPVRAHVVPFETYTYNTINTLPPPPPPVGGGVDNWVGVFIRAVFRRGGK